MIDMRSMSLVQNLKKIVGDNGVIYAPEEMIVYECDGLTLEKHAPDMVVLPASTEQVVEVVKLLHRERVPFAPRGAGTGLSGGALTVGGGVVISTTRMNRILEVDLRNRRALVEAGVVNLRITNEVSANSYHFAPDPSSQGSCTIGGNIAENSSGPHTLKYGVTTNHVISVQVVLPNGECMWLGGKAEDEPGYDLTGLWVGSEGTFGIVTQAWVRLTRLPQSYRTMLVVFDTVDDAASTVSGIIAAGIIPAALEMIDAVAMEAVEAAFHFGFPLDAQAVLIIELDGLEPALDRQAERVVSICNDNHAREVRRAETEEQRNHLWMSRKRAFGALGRISPNYLTQDGVVPRTKIPQMLRFIYQVGEKYNLRIANTFHAGDGNMHPCILYDERNQDQIERMLKASAEILGKCVEMGGSVTGEHGIGLEKREFMPMMFSEADLEIMQKVKSVFNPNGLCNPQKIFPTSAGCVEMVGMRKAAAL